MPDEPTPPAAGDELAADPSNAGDESGNDNPEGEGTTPEEVASVLKSSGINLPPEPTAAADDEEGDDPDKPTGEETGDEPAGGEEIPGSAGEGKSTEEVANEDPLKPDPEAGKDEADIPLNTREADEDKYSFEVTDANGVTFKIPVGAQMEDVLSEFEPKNNGQIIDILSKLQDMKAEKAADDKVEAENTAKAEQAQKVSEIQKGWKAEEADLIAQKRIPEGEDGEKRIADVYKFMGQENDKRIAAGRPTLASFEDAFDKLETIESRQAAADKVKADKEEARKKGALVGGSSAAVTSAPKAYRAGSARNANDAIRQMGLIS